MAALQSVEVLQAARQHDVNILRSLLRRTSASVQDPDTLSSPLHQAVLGAGERLKNDVTSAGTNVNLEGSDEVQRTTIIKAAQDTMRLLLEKGAIWNDLDNSNETPGCLALRLDLNDLYDIMVDAGVRAEMLLNRLDEYEALSDDDDDDVEAANQPTKGGPGEALDTNAPKDANVDLQTQSSDNGAIEQDLRNDNYLKSSLRFEHDRVLDKADNGVMMQWENELMQRHADLLCSEKGLRVLNIGFGMGKSII